MEIDLRSKEKKQKKVLNLVTYQKIKKFLQKYNINDVFSECLKRRNSSRITPVS